MRVTICGARGSIPVSGPGFVRAGGDTSCVAIAVDGAVPSLVLDAGTGARTVSGLLGGAPFRGAIVLTHLHWDHIQGLPFLSAADHPDAEVSLTLPEQGADPRSLLERVMSPPFFPIGPDALAGAWSFGSYDAGESRLGPFGVLAREVPHTGGRTMGLRVSQGGASVAYIPDHGPQVLGAGADGLGPLHEEVLALARGADLLIHDAQYTAAEFPDRARYGHSAAEYALALARAAGVARLMLFHHDPCRDDAALDAIADGLRRPGGPEISVAAAGMVADL